MFDHFLFSWYAWGICSLQDNSYQILYILEKANSYAINCLKPFQCVRWFWTELKWTELLFISINIVITLWHFWIFGFLISKIQFKIWSNQSIRLSVSSHGEIDWGSTINQNTKYLHITNYSLMLNGVTDGRDRMHLPR